MRTSVAQGALLAVGQYLAAATAGGSGGPPEPRLPPGSAGQAGGLATLITSDGVRVEVETLDPDAWREFWVRLGAAPAVAGRGWLPFQQRFATAVCPLPEALRQAARRHTLPDLRAAAHHSGVSLLVVRSGPASAVHPEPWELAPWPEPARGRGPHADSAAEVPSPRPARDADLPLTGMRVVESTRRVQGPLAGHILRMLGADVVRIEPPGGDPMRWLPRWRESARPGSWRSTRESR